MALVVSVAGEDKARRSSFRAEKRPWMLQDYLRDDANSCSSNGFRSFPRRECCAAAVRNIIEKEFIRNGRNGSKTPTKPLKRSRTISSALRKASMAVINAVKLLPFKPSSTATTGESKRLLPRSFSKRLFKGSFSWWSSKKSSVGERTVVKSEVDGDDEIERWISSGIVATENYQPLDLSNETTVTYASTTTRNSNSDGKSDCWSDITFSTSDYGTISSENETVERREKWLVKEVVETVVEEEREVSDGVAATDEDSVEPEVVENAWQNEETEKEQLSPISVMDFPDNDEGNSSPFTLRTNRLKGSKERLVKSWGRFETLAGLGLQPINLEGLMSSTLVKDRSPELSIQSCTTPTFIISSDSEDSEEEEGDIDDEEDDEADSGENEGEKKAENLLKLIKANVPTLTFYEYELEIVLLDYFRKNATEKDEDTLLKVAMDWLNGHHDRLILGWEVEDKRQAYIRDMEEGGSWPRENKLEKEEVASELEALVLENLIQELLLE